MPAASFLSLFLPYAFANGVGSFYRTVTAVVAPDLIDDLALSAADLGLLTSMFFLAYAAVQIPLGMLLDRLGARRVTATLFAIAAVACAVFATSSDFTVLAIARAVMGLGISVSLMGGLKAMVESFPRDKIALGNALILMAGGLGTMGATAPVQFALQFTDWRGVFVGIAGATLVLALVLIIVAPRKPHVAAEAGASSLRGVIKAITHRQFLRLVPLASSTQGVNMSLMGLWAGPWLRDVTGVGRGEAAAVLFGMAAVATVSVLLTGWIATRLQRTGIPVLATACVGMAGFIVFEALIALDIPITPFVLWLPLAYFATSPSLAYTVFAGSFPPELAGRVNTAYNFTTFVFAFALQWAMGAVIDLWPPLADGRFAPDGYRWALAGAIALQLAAFLWFALAPRARDAR